MELVRWLGEVGAHVQSLFLPFPCPYAHGEKTPTIAQSGWATVKLGIDLGEVFSKAPELGRGQKYYSAT